jgi:predicted AlkP superfamily phosphohydrolase/phosphomutase/tetratricopeptide (TPR) repeat protein
MAAQKVLLVGWDAADWKVIQPLIDAGKMPNVQRLMEGGAWGQISTLHPPLSPMLWTSIATGKRPFKHGIHGFSEPTQDGSGVQPVTNLSRTSKALWNILNQNRLRSILVGWWPSHPAEPINGVMVSDRYHRASGPLDQGWPLPANAVHPAELSATLAGLRVHPELLSPELVERFIPLAREIDQDIDQNNDKRLAVVLRTIGECMTIQAAAVWLLEHRPWDFAAVYYDSIDHFSHGFMKYHPPRQAWIGERDFELYHGVVSMAYQFHDEMLGTLLRKAGEETIVVLMSDHGFHPDHLRPASIPAIPAGPAIEHRDFGILAMGGRGIKRGELLYGSSVLDVAPTILTMYGLPCGEDMDGKVLSQAFVDPPQIEAIPSWEEVPGADGRHPPHTRLDPVAAHEALEQLIALGYIERPAEDRAIAVEKTIRELRYNLGEAYQDAGRHREAHQIFSDLHAAAGEEQRFAVKLFASCQALGEQAEMQRIVEGLPGPQALIDYLQAQVLIGEKRYADALAAMERVPGVHLQSADLYERLGRCGDALEVYEEALALDPDNAQAHIGVCRMALRRRDFSVAAHAALDALQRVHQYPLAHFLLGRALTGLQEYQRAAEAFRIAISFNPNFPEAHVRLAGLLARQLNDQEAAKEHRRLARRMRRSRSTPQSAAAPAERLEICGGSTTIESEMPPWQECLIVVTGLPRSGTSMLMQMLSAGGLEVLADAKRQADPDNPRGYFEYQPVKALLNDSRWLFEARGKAVKIVAPLLAGLPRGLPCRVMLIERDLDEVLDSQERMLARSNGTAEGRRLLKAEYARMLGRAKVLLARRPRTRFLVLEHREAIDTPRAIAERVSDFLGTGLDVAKMAAAIDPYLHRNRVGKVP